jgi:hypothetical protein
MLIVPYFCISFIQKMRAAKPGRIMPAMAAKLHGTGSVWGNITKQHYNRFYII